MEENTSSWLRRAKYSHTVCHRFDTSRKDSTPFPIQSERNSTSSKGKRNFLANKQRSLSPLPKTLVSDVFREAKHELKRFSTPDPRRDKRIMGKVSSKESRELPKVPNWKSPFTSPNRQKMSKGLSKDSSWSNLFENSGGGGKVSALETAEEWTIDMSKLLIGHKFAHGAHSRLYHGEYKKETVAVKIIRVPDDDDNGDLASRLENQFVREVTLLSRLHHRNVIKVIMITYLLVFCMLISFATPLIIMYFLIYFDLITVHSCEQQSPGLLYNHRIYIRRLVEGLFA